MAKANRLTKKDCATLGNTTFKTWYRYLQDELARRNLPPYGEQTAYDAYLVGQSPWTEAGEASARHA